MIRELQENYGYIFEETLIEDINQVGTFREVVEGQKLIEIGEYVRSIPLLISGAVKVLREDKDGEELLLYFLERGDTCAMTMVCCMGSKKSDIRAVAETDTKLIMIPVQKMEEWMAKYASWRGFVMESYHSRFNEMLEAIDNLAFLKMDQRLLKYLQDRAKVNHDDIVHTTHQQIAYDMHTSRVVISRLLKALEKEGKIELHRNHLKVIEL